MNTPPTQSELEEMLDTVLRELQIARTCALVECERANRAEAERDELRSALRTFMETFDVRSLEIVGDKTGKRLANLAQTDATHQ